jgi:hypothetical protein
VLAAIPPRAVENVMAWPAKSVTEEVMAAFPNVLLVLVSVIGNTCLDAPIRPDVRSKLYVNAVPDCVGNALPASHAVIVLVAPLV